MRGRKPKPTQQKIREGNPGKRKIVPALEIAPARTLPCPPDLPAAGKELWEEIVPRLSAVGILNEVDRAALEALCVQYAHIVTARRVLAAEGMFALGSTGQLVEHPAVGILRSATMLFIRIAEQYGLTPAARARLAADAAIAKGSVKGDLDEILRAPPEAFEPL